MKTFHWVDIKWWIIKWPIRFFFFFLSQGSFNYIPTDLYQVHEKQIASTFTSKNLLQISYHLKENKNERKRK
jgi:hypothetical protein